MTISDLWRHHRSETGFNAEKVHEGFWFDWGKLESQLMPEVGIILSASRRTAQVEYTYPVYAVIFRTGDWFDISDEKLTKDVLHHTEGDGRSAIVNAIDVLRQFVPTVSLDRRDEGMKHLNALIRILKPVL